LPEGVLVERQLSPGSSQVGAKSFRRRLACWLLPLLLLSATPLSALTLVSAVVIPRPCLSLDWDSTGTYLAIGQTNGTGAELFVYQFTGSTLVLRSSVNTTGSPYSVKWSPDGLHLAVANTANPGVLVYSFNAAANTLTLLSSANLGQAVYSVAWAPDGIHLAAGTAANPAGAEVVVFAFSSSAGTLSLKSSYECGGIVSAVDWSPSGAYLAVGGTNASTQGQVLAFDGVAATLVQVSAVVYGVAVRSVAWSADGQSLALGGSSPTSGYEVQVYAFDGSSLTLRAGFDTGTAVDSLSWSGTSRHLAVGGAYSLAASELRVLEFDATAGALLPVSSRESTTNDNAVAWMPDHCGLALGEAASGPNVLVFLFDEDSDCDGVRDDGDGSGTAGDHPCACPQTYGCDDNAPTVPNPAQCPVIRGRVWMDDDGDGLQDAGESGRSGVAVALYDGAAHLLDSALTDGQGRFAFDVEDGQFGLQFTAPPGAIFTARGEGSDRSLDSDVDPMTGASGAFSASGVPAVIADAGLVTGCVAPDQPVWISGGTKSETGCPVLTFTDPNPPARRTGYSVRRGDDPSTDEASWPLLGDNVTDMDSLTPGYQWTDATGPPGTWYYQITAYHALCGLEGPF